MVKLFFESFISEPCQKESGESLDVKKHNVLCERCRYSWYAPEAEKGEMPKYCLRCHQKSLVYVEHGFRLTVKKAAARFRAVPARLSKAGSRTAESVKEFMHEHRFLIDFIIFIIALVVVVLVAQYFIG